MTKFHVFHTFYPFLKNFCPDLEFVVFPGKNPPTGNFYQTCSIRYIRLTHVKSDIWNKHKQHNVESQRNDDMNMYENVKNSIYK